MTMRVVLTCVAVCLAVGCAGAAKIGSLPKDFIKCKRNDDTCLKTAIQKALPPMAKGLPKLGVLSIDPLRVTEMSIDQGNSGPVSLKLILKDQDLLGISSSRVDNVRSNMTDESYMLHVDVTIPTFILRGNYVVDGRVLLLPIKGQGKDNLTLTDLTATLISSGNVIERGGLSYVDITDYSFKFDTTRLYIELENLFNGEKTLGDTMSTVLNDNWREVLNEVQPGIEEALTAVFKAVSKRVYSRVPYSTMHEN